jgi:hypothetical protein
MARQTGALKYTGTIGDIRHFKIKGLKGSFAGLIGGPTSEQIASAPEDVGGPSYHQIRELFSFL